MTPAERVVVEAALRWHAERHVPGSITGGELYKAVNALLAERADPATPKERELTWGQAVVGDEILSDRTRRWYEVTNVVGPGVLDGGRVKLWLKGLPKPVQPKAADPVKLRRGEMGKVVDVFASVLWSGQSAPDASEAEEMPAPDPAHDPEASAPEPGAEEEEVESDA